ncbi:uncharacterized protein LOC127754030 [Oryza glaberrima]|uniref:uncharacterized protein LOC127754030 n=1 Tax=Oryza glaberrima TaxID=4538 RepID=UPI00224C3B76|nr:uncharacterized protein LOC127754030 [Oryza glaberrima]
MYCTLHQLPSTACTPYLARKFFGGFSAVRKYVGIEVSTEETRVFLPTCCNNFPFQPASREWSLSMTGWRCALLILPIVKGTTELLLRFTCSPVARPKFSSKVIRLSTSARLGFRKIAASSAYSDVRNFATLFDIGDKIPWSLAIFSIVCNGSIANMKR